MFEPLYAQADHSSESPESRWIFVKGSQILVKDSFDGVRLPTYGEAAAATAAVSDVQILGRRDGLTYWAGSLPEQYEGDAGFRLSDLRGLFADLEEHEWNAGGRATQIMDWVRDNRFCGRCGAQMQQLPNERSMKCAVDGFTAYPRLSPAVIMLVTNDQGQALLGRSGLWKVPMYSTLAGFVEPGETLEETVKREVFEEVGLDVHRVRYFGSQSWPFPNSLMLGFTAVWKGGEINIDGEEIVDAQWFDPSSLPMIPPRQSIARQLIDAWLAT